MAVHRKEIYPRLYLQCRRAAKSFGALALVATALAACEKAPPETQLAAAGEALGEATTELADLNTRIEQTETLLDQLRADRREQRDTVRTLEERLEARATDVAVFRAVQTALLDEPSLQNAAIAVDVEERAVTLSGVVRTQQEASQAVAIARQTAGVANVSSKIWINDPAAEKASGS